MTDIQKSDRRVKHRPAGRIWQGVNPGIGKLKEITNDDNPYNKNR